jgi:hypothetical protein
MSLSYLREINDGGEGLLVAKIKTKKSEKEIYYHPFNRVDLNKEYEREDLLALLAKLSSQIADREYIDIDVRKQINLEDIFISGLSHVPSSLNEKRLYNAMCEEIDLLCSRFVDLSGEGNYIIEPQADHLYNQRVACFISGKSGSGKSTIVSSLVKSYLNTHPGTPIYLITRKESDPVFDNIAGLNRMLINKDLLAKVKRGIVNVDFFSDSVVVFDDWDFLQEKGSESLVKNLLNSLLNLGRSKNIHVFTIVHKSLSGDKTKTLFDEASSMCLFPSMNYPEAYKCLKKFLNLSDKKANQIMSSYRNERWLYVILPNLFVSSSQIRIWDL